MDTVVLLRNDCPPAGETQVTHKAYTPGPFESPMPHVQSYRTSPSACPRRSVLPSHSGFVTLRRRRGRSTSSAGKWYRNSPRDVREHGMYCIDLEVWSGENGIEGNSRTISGVTFFGRNPRTAEGDAAPFPSLEPMTFPSVSERQEAWVSKNNATRISLVRSATAPRVTIGRT